MRRRLTNLFCGVYLVICLLGLSRALGAPPTTYIVAALPDTQFYSETYPEIFTAQTQWLADNAAAWNIVFVTHEGDITNHGNRPAQWANALKAMDLLSGKVPYATCPGNHDTGGLPATAPSTRPAAPPVETTLPAYVAHFGPARYKGQAWSAPWYGGSSADGINSYQEFKAGGRTFLALSLDYNLPEGAIAFARETIKANPGLPTIVTTHAFLDLSGKRLASAEKAWTPLIDANPQIFLVLCGHKHGESKRVDNNSAGQPVIQLLADYQAETKGGNGYLRLLMFDEAAGKIHVKTYSPFLDQYQTRASSDFDVDVNLAERFEGVKADRQ